MKQYRPILLALTCLVIVFSCKKDKTPSCPTTGASNCEEIQNVKHFFYFKVGSWWVYEEETSGALDTVYVTEAAENPSNYDFDIRVYSTYEDYYYHFWPEYASGAQACSEDGVICQYCITIKRSKYQPGNVLGQYNCFFYIPTVGEYDYNSNTINPYNVVRINSKYLEYFLSGLSFTRTFQIHEDNNRHEDYQETNHYFSENVGLVRKELLDSTKVWNLVDYYIQP